MLPSLPDQNRSFPNDQGFLIGLGVINLSEKELRRNKRRNWREDGIYCILTREMCAEMFLQREIRCPNPRKENIEK